MFLNKVIQKLKMLLRIAPNVTLFFFKLFSSLVYRLLIDAVTIQRYCFLFRRQGHANIFIKVKIVYTPTVTIR